MTITDHKRLTAAIPEDLKTGEEVEVSDDMEEWCLKRSNGYDAEFGRIVCMDGTKWNYARRPAPKLKRLKEEPWPKDPLLIYRVVSPNGSAWLLVDKPTISGSSWTPVAVAKYIGDGYDSTDWQNSMEERPEETV